MAQVQREAMTLARFRSTDLLSGEVRVVGGSRTRRGARRHTRPASCNSPKEAAGTDAASAVAAGESAHTSAAHAASRGTDADLAKSRATNAGDAPTKKSTRMNKTKSKSTKKPNRKKESGPNGKAPSELQTKPEGASKDSTKGNAENGNKSSGGGSKGGEPPIESLWEERVMLDGGEPLPNDSAAFVDAVNQHIDLVRTSELLLRGRDEKSSKSLLELLLEMKYGGQKRAPAEHADAVISCVPQAARD
ncbi:MAG: hypothetical protein WBR26_03300 [Candidatus Acidiferrum sp.]